MYVTYIKNPSEREYAKLPNNDFSTKINYGVSLNIHFLISKVQKNKNFGGASMNLKINDDLLELYGILIGDGCISRFESGGRTHYAIRIDGNSITDYQYYKEYLKPLIERIIERKVSIRSRKIGNCIFIMFEYKEFAISLHNQLGFPYGKKGEISINERITHRKQLLPVLRGIFDTDGCLYFTKNNSEKRFYPIIELSTHSTALVNQLESIFKSLGFRVKISHYKDSVKLHGKENLFKFMHHIGSNHPDKLSKFEHWKRFGYCPRIDELDFEARVKKLRPHSSGW